MGTDAFFPTSLWDLLPRRRRSGQRQRPSSPPSPRPSRSSTAGRSGKQRRYDQLVARMKHEHDVRVHRWRSSTSGCAWQVYYRDGSVSRLIESPYPRGPVSAAVFLHEVGHHAIGFGRHKPRCLEEYRAWRWALAAMDAHGVTITDRVRRRVDQHIRGMLRRALRRGLKRIPEELEPYVRRDGHSAGQDPNDESKMTNQDRK